MTAKRILAGLLVMLMLVPVFCACNPDMPDTPDVPGSDSDTNPEDTTAPEDKGLVLDVTDFDGTALRIYGLSKDYAYDIMLRTTSGLRLTPRILWKPLCTNVYRIVSINTISTFSIQKPRATV